MPASPFSITTVPDSYATGTSSSINRSSVVSGSGVKSAFRRRRARSSSAPSRPRVWAAIGRRVRSPTSGRIAPATTSAPRTSSNASMAGASRLPSRSPTPSKRLHQPEDGHPILVRTRRCTSVKPATSSSALLTPVAKSAMSATGTTGTETDQDEWESPADEREREKSRQPAHADERERPERADEAPEADHRAEQPDAAVAEVEELERDDDDEGREQPADEDLDDEVPDHE